MVWWHYASC